LVNIIEKVPPIRRDFFLEEGKLSENREQSSEYRVQSSEFRVQIYSLFSVL
jgi:hypothetical protein